MILECPHCHATVVAREGECPSCRRRVDDPSGADPTRAAVRIREGDRLPARCVLCDGPAARRARVRRVARGGMPVEGRVFLAGAAAVFGAVAAPVIALVLWVLIAFPPLLLLLLPLLALPGIFVLVAVAAGGSAGPALSRSRRQRADDRRPVRVFIPVCGVHRRSPLEPLSVDTEGHAMTFLADRRFAARVGTRA